MALATTATTATAATTATDIAAGSGAAMKATSTPKMGKKVKAKPDTKSGVAADAQTPPTSTTSSTPSTGVVTPEFVPASTSVNSPVSTVTSTTPLNKSGTSGKKSAAATKKSGTSSRKSTRGKKAVKRMRARL